ncbi:hypothetical protein SDC9_157537 [bioreactor metagenome]|uniref:Uncharacterized protein n=1 Tax=bioreactor metagenome TaxID=1076179 RepID=A0A645F9K7_9ZZZZ
MRHGADGRRPHPAGENRDTPAFIVARISQHISDGVDQLKVSQKGLCYHLGAQRIAGH